MASRKVSVAEIFDTNPFSPYQVWVSILCFCIMFLEGFDMMIIGVALPKIADYLHSKPGALGLAVSAGQVGPLVGAIVLGMVADRWGRKRTLYLSAIVFGLFTALTAYITNVEELALLRFLAGIGLGGAIPNALAFGCEYAPSKKRTTLATTMYAGVALGSVTAGLLSAWVIPAYGWQSLFKMGGIVPVIIGIAMAFLLPETLDFLVKRGKDEKELRRIICKIAPALGNDPGVEFCSTEQKLSGAPVKHLFREGRSTTTILIWVAFLMSFFLLWIILAWAPTLLRKSGATPQQYSIAFACINFGSLIATLLVGRLMDKINPFTILKIGFVLAFLSVVGFGFMGGSSLLAISIVCVVMGFFVIGGNSGLMGLATVSYPSDIRGSGIGWAYGVSKIGSLLSPAFGGLLLSQGWSSPQICTTNAVAALVVVVVVFILQKHVTNAAKRKAA
jgi:MFS transporter, AAHS family, 4-hydroxybenzoate transporter